MKVSNFAKAALAVAVTAVLGAVSAPAYSAAVANQLVTPGVINEWEDRDVERFLDANGAPIAMGDIGVGYTIQTILRFTGFAPQIGGTNIIGDFLPSPYQLTSYAELNVAAIFDPTGTATLGSDTCTFIDSVTGSRQCTLLFTPTGNLGANVFANLYERTAAAQPSYNEALDPTAGIAAVMAQTLIASIGLGDTDDFWFATTLMDLGIAATAGAGSPQQANGVLGLSVLSNPGAIPFGTNAIQSGTTGTYHDVVGNASAYQRASGTNEGWLVSSNTTINFFAVPEPSSLALAGLALLGLGAAARRRKV